MSIEVTCTGGNPSKTGEESFRLGFQQDTFSFGFLDKPSKAEFPLAEWAAFVGQVNSKQFASLRYQSDVPPPMGDPRAKAVLGVIDSTPRMQLFYATIEIAGLLALPKNQDPSMLLGRWLSLFNIYTGRGSDPGLYFLPESISWNLDIKRRDTYDLLVRSHILCKALLSLGGESEYHHYYTPYNLPITMRGDFPPDVESVMEEIRNLRYTSAKRRAR